MKSFEELKEAIKLGIFDVKPEQIRDAIHEIEKKAIESLRLELKKVYEAKNLPVAELKIWLLAKKYSTPYQNSPVYKAKLVEIYEELSLLQRPL